MGGGTEFVAIVVMLFYAENSDAENSDAENSEKTIKNLWKNLNYHNVALESEKKTQENTNLQTCRNKEHIAYLKKLYCK